MILRKPFAILIKYFKLIHVFQSILFGFLIYFYTNIHEFLYEYLNSPGVLIDPSKTSELFNVWLFILPIILFAGFTIIASLMKVKKKPLLFYILVDLILIIGFVFTSSVHPIIRELEIKFLDVRTLKIIQDLYTTLIIVQGIMFIQTIIRATGFDIKKFNFNQDLEELQIEEDDNEEFEVNVELEKGKWKRRLNKVIRIAKYTFKENKLVVSIFIAIFILGFSYFTYHHIYITNKIYNQNDVLSIENIDMSVQNSYKTYYNIKNKKNNDTFFVVANINLNKVYGNTDVLPAKRIFLESKKHYFYHNKKLEKDFYDLGNTYKEQILTNDKSLYSFIYEIPNSLYNEDLFIVFELNTGKRIKIKLTPKEINLPNKPLDFKLTEKVEFKDSILHESSLLIKDYKLDKTFVQNYNYCPVKDLCYPSIRYVIPSYTSNYNKYILKLDLEYKKDKEVEIDKVSDFLGFINTFGKLSYVVDGKKYTYTNLKKISTKINDGFYYVEVNENIALATDIWFEVNVRDKQYNYVLKQEGV